MANAQWLEIQSGCVSVNGRTLRDEWIGDSISRNLFRGDGLASVSSLEKPFFRRVDRCSEI